MPKVMLKFNLPEEQESFDDALKGSSYKWKLENIWEQLFRPRHKYGYENQRLTDLTNDDKVNEAMDILEEMYKNILKEYEE